MNKYIVMTSSAKMPSKCWGKYGNVAIVETDGINQPKQIHSRHKTVKAVKYYWGRLFVGKTENCAFQRTLKEAQEIVEKLNS